MSLFSRRGRQSGAVLIIGFSFTATSAWSPVDVIITGWVGWITEGELPTRPVTVNRFHDPGPTNLDDPPPEGGWVYLFFGGGFSAKRFARSANGDPSGKSSPVPNSHVCAELPLDTL